MRLAKLPVTLVRPEGGEKAPPVLMLHGIGLGRWIFERMQRELAAQGVPSVAVDLPGHGEHGGDPALDEVLDAVSEAVTQMPGCSLLGHSFGGYVAQVVASRVPVHALSLVAALPTAGLPFRPTRVGVRVGLRYLHHVALGRPLHIRYEDYVATGLSLCPADQQRAYYERIGPWPGRLVRELIRRPHRVDPTSVRAPVVVCLGAQDPILRWQDGRRLGEWYDGLVWRFDDLGHLPMLQAEGVRLERDVAAWLVEPRGRKVTEVDAWQPNEGRGLQARDAARGDQGRQRSAYGQRLGRQGERATDRWDQNIG